MAEELKLGGGLLHNIHKSNIVEYKPLTIKDLEKFMRGFSRHNLRDSKGRFKKRTIGEFYKDGQCNTITF